MTVRRPRWIDRKLPGFFLEWRSQWVGPSSERMTPLNYIDWEKAFPPVVAAAWLFCPETVEYRDCIFLKDHFGQANVDTWFDSLNGNHEAVEAMVNHTHLSDVCSCTVEALRTRGSSSDFGRLDDDLESLAWAVGECWQGILAARYPERGVIVQLCGEDDKSADLIITFWTDHTDQSAQ
jgi:hypothetical protein